MTVVLVALTLGTALLQAGFVQAIPASPLAAPTIIVAIVAGWSAVRDPDEAWPALILPALALGTLSEERVAWFLVALLPAPAIVALLRARERVEPGWRQRVATAAVAGVTGGLAYAAVLAVAGGVAGELVTGAGGIVGGALATGMLAALAATLLWPLRPRQRSLFA